MFRRTQFTAATDDDANKHFTMKIVTWPDEQGTTTAFIPNKLAPISSIHSFIHSSTHPLITAEYFHLFLLCLFTLLFTKNILYYIEENLQSLNKFEQVLTNLYELLIFIFF